MRRKGGLGAARDGRLLVVIHTHTEIDTALALIRIVSARKPTKREAQQYLKGGAS